MLQKQSLNAAHHNSFRLMRRNQALYGSTSGQSGVSLGSTGGQPGVNLRSILGQPGVNLGSTWCKPRVILGSASCRHRTSAHVKLKVNECVPLPSSPSGASSMEIRSSISLIMK